MRTHFESGPVIDSVTAACYKIPTETPESDGTLVWDQTTLVTVEVAAGKETGLGYSYADSSTGRLIETLLAQVVKGRPALDIPAIHAAMRRAVRNLGGAGIAAMAISAVDTALWDLKGRLLQVSLIDLLGAARLEAPVYGSGGFTSYSLEKLQAQLGDWAQQGLKSVKMKIGRDPAADLHRVRAAREAIGSEVQLFVDANGAYSRKEALRLANEFAGFGVTWFEEPVSSDDLDGLHFLRERVPALIEIAAGEYGYDPLYFRRMLTSGAVDVLQSDATRCCGFTGFLEVGALCDAFQTPFSFHCAPALHAGIACAVPTFRIGEYFFDHARIEEMLFDGVPKLIDGALKPDRSRPGVGLELKRASAEGFRIS